MAFIMRHMMEMTDVQVIFKSRWIQKGNKNIISTMRRMFPWHFKLKSWWIRRYTEVWICGFHLADRDSWWMWITRAQRGRILQSLQCSVDGQTLFRGDSETLLSLNVIISQTYLWKKLLRIQSHSFIITIKQTIAINKTLPTEHAKTCETINFKYISFSILERV